jgi:hypothetical protein
MPVIEAVRRSKGEPDVQGKLVTLKLNAQQLELLDRTVARGAAPDRLALIRLALVQYAAKHAKAAPGAKS